MLRRLTLAVAGALLIASPAVAQSDCQDLYARMMRSYQRNSPNYPQRRQEYAQQCQQQGGTGCRSLRAACMNKRQLGEQGEGNCRRYREQCRQ